ncbi:HTH-type transcriptional regulator AbgR [Delftia tsuruhatensis]|uniref:LysR family transcriptional regulator n=1 Tax=Delftia tsuruhatensis TaxID=180282 RepID=UPI001E725F48|nr:LysR family transcriptional regulator [Delftia tsuruhatensis]CAB5686193.1 HTH-type transcriptional regulator AbgR [Delftia tsuruhatensis]CAC9690357.1 HTH-type transcriptional regulator AbgR [Delftia tsuruhatensis]
MHIDQRQLQCFLEVVNTGSINRAAQKLHIAQPALSRRIQQLEHALGTELFVRTKAGVDLTAPGQRLYGKAQAWLMEFERLQQSMRQEVEPGGDVLRLGMAAGPMALLLPRVMAWAVELSPGLRLRVIEGDRPSLREQIFAGQLDFAISTDVCPQPRIAREPLWKEALFLVAPRATADRPAPFVIPTSDSDIARAVADAAASIGLHPDSGIAVTPTASVKRLIAAGGARSILPFSAVHEEALKDSLQLQSIPGAFVERHLIWLKDRPRSAAADALHAAIRHSVSAMLAATGGECLVRSETASAP